MQEESLFVVGGAAGILLGALIGIRLTTLVLHGHAGVDYEELQTHLVELGYAEWVAETPGGKPTTFRLVEPEELKGGE